LLWTFEDKPEFFAEVEWMKTPWHQILLIPSPLTWPKFFPAEDWSIVFVDHAEPMGTEKAYWRNETLKAVAELAPNAFVIIHDSHLGGIEHYGLASGIACYKYQHECYEWYPGSLVLSNHRPWPC
jgi:hypothetical protein